MSTDEIVRHVDVPVTPIVAWDLFANHFPAWWPREHCFCGEAALDTVFIDLVAMVWGEITLSGERRTWGKVLAYEPGGILSLGWQMDATISPWVPEPDPGRASLIDIAFKPQHGGARVTLRHHGFARQGEPHAQAMRDVMIGLDRWREWLDLFRRFVARST